MYVKLFRQLSHGDLAWFFNVDGMIYISYKALTNVLNIHVDHTGSIMPGTEYTLAFFWHIFVYPTWYFVPLFGPPWGPGMI